MNSSMGATNPFSRSRSQSLSQFGRNTELVSVIFLKSRILKRLFNREEFNLRHTATLHQRPKCSTPELASQQMACVRTASQLSTAPLPQRKVRSGGTDETGGIPGGSALAGFLNDVRRSRPDAHAYLYLLPFPGFARRPTLPRCPDFSQALSNGQAPDSRPTQTKSAWSASLGSFPCRWHVECGTPPSKRTLTCGAKSGAGYLRLPIQAYSKRRSSARNCNY